MAKKLMLDDYMLELVSARQYGFGGDNKDRISRMKSFLKKAFDSELTEKQKKYISGYFFEGKTMRELAGEYGVCESNISKTIKRAVSTLNARSVYLKI